MSTGRIYRVTISVSDNSLIDSQEIIITILDLDEGPKSISLTNTLIEENKAAGTFIGTFSTTGMESSTQNSLNYGLVAHYPFNGNALDASQSK